MAQFPCHLEVVTPHDLVICQRSMVSEKKRGGTGPTEEAARVGQADEAYHGSCYERGLGWRVGRYAGTPPW